jgi:hypothetical protein
VLSGRGLCDELITRPEEYYRLWCVVVCDLENLKNEEAMIHVGSQRHIKIESPYAYESIANKSVTTFNATICLTKFSQQTYSARTMVSKPCILRTHMAKSGCLVSLTLMRDVFVININRQGFTFKHTRFMVFLCADGKTRRTLQVTPRQIIPNLLHPKGYRRFHFLDGLLERLNISISKVTKASFHFMSSNFQHTI